MSCCLLQGQSGSIHRGAYIIVMKCLPFLVLLYTAYTGTQNNCMLFVPASTFTCFGADATKEQTLGADSTEYVEVPLDVMLQYFYRAKRAVAGLPVGKRLVWLQARDSDERSEWVTKFREGTRSLGAVVKELMASRDAHWLPHVVADNQLPPHMQQWRPPSPHRNPSS